MRPRAAARAAASAGMTAAVLLGAGCPFAPGGKPGRGAGAGAAARSDPAPGVLPALRRTEVLFELGGAPSPSPLVLGSAGGRRTAMIVDTGAESHVLAEWLAVDARLPTRAATEAGHDAIGSAVTFSIVDRPALALEGWGAVADRPIAVTRVPAFFRDLGVGVILSPQLLATAGAAVLLDLAPFRMELLPYDAAVAGLEGRGLALVPAGLRVCSDPRAAVENLAYVVPGAAEGVVVSFRVDTGARVTTLFDGSPAAVALAARATDAPDAHGASGTAAAKVVKGAHIRAGDTERTLDVRIAPGARDPACPFDGLLGIDFLRACALVLAPDRMTGTCAETVKLPPASVPAAAP